MEKQNSVERGDNRLKEIESYERKLRWQKFHDLCPPEYRYVRRDYKPDNALITAPNWEAYDRVQQWQYGPRGIMATGDTGTGKTRAVWQLVRRLIIDDAHHVSAHTFCSFANRAEQLMEVGRGRFADWIDALQRTEILFLDDFGRSYFISSREAWLEMQVLGLIEVRHAHRRPMLLTTNMTADDLKKRYQTAGDPLIRRLVNACEIVHF